MLERTYQIMTFSYGIVGLLRPLTVYPSEMVYWTVRLVCYLVKSKFDCSGSRLCLWSQYSRVRLLTLFRRAFNATTALHFNTKMSAKQVKLFWTTFTGMFVYEVIPAYIFPLLNAVNVFCLGSQHASQKTVDVFTHIFGGASGNEGLGLFSLSFDWQYIGSG
jgi:OPT oligopeptide transporter protein